MKNLTRPLLVIVSILLMFLVSANRPVRASTDAEFIGFLEEAWVNAIIQKDVNVLDRVLADDFGGASPSGEPIPNNRPLQTSGLDSIRSRAWTWTASRYGSSATLRLSRTIRMRRVRLVRKIVAVATSSPMCGSTGTMIGKSSPHRALRWNCPRTQ